VLVLAQLVPVPVPVLLLLLVVVVLLVVMQVGWRQLVRWHLCLRVQPRQLTVVQLTILRFASPSRRHHHHCDKKWSYTAPSATRYVSANQTDANYRSTACRWPAGCKRG
jgi:hypothetical protein